MANDDAGAHEEAVLRLSDRSSAELDRYTDDLISYGELAEPARLDLSVALAILANRREEEGRRVRQAALRAMRKGPIWQTDH